MKMNWQAIVGLVLHGLIGALMILSGSAKIFGLMPAAEVEKTGMADQIVLIGAGEVITAILLLIPRTSSLGVLLTSAFWGGTICLHMSHHENYVMQSVLLVMTWIGAYLRNPAMMGSFWGAPASRS